MKATLITIHVGFNFGSVLQTIASVKALNKLGYEVKVIDYRPKRVTIKQYWKEAIQGFPIKFLWRILYFPIFFKNRQIYSGYLKKYCTLTDPIYTRKEFEQKCPSSDLYVVGSDQVWNSIHNQGFDEIYFYPFIKDNKISLSSSIGRSHIDNAEKKLFKRHLASFKAISVREKSAQILLSKIGIKSTVLLDPTFMLSKEEWLTYSSNKLIKKSYLLLYLPYNIVNKEIILKSAKIIAQKLNLKIITFSWNLFSDKETDETIKFASPGDFLSLMYHADFVITNSFHGTAFSINLNKQFYVFQPSAFSTRIQNILELTGLNDRMLMNTLIDNNIKKIDYYPINLILEKERLRSFNFLKQSLV